MRGSRAVVLSRINEFMAVSFLFPAVLILRLQVWRRRRALAGKSPPPDSDLFDDAEFGKNLANLSNQFAASLNR
jgi:hypothetical protein